MKRSDKRNSWNIFEDFENNYKEIKRYVIKIKSLIIMNEKSFGKVCGGSVPNLTKRCLGKGDRHIKIGQAL